MTVNVALPANSLPESKLTWHERVAVQLRKDGVTLCLNSELVPVARIKGDGFRSEWAVDDQRFMDLIITTCLSEPDLAKWTPFDMRVLPAILREEARRGGRSLTEVEADKTGNDVVVQLVLAFMDDKSEYNGKTADLHDCLRNLDALMRPFAPKPLTAFLHVFSRQVNARAIALAGWGVQALIWHEDDGSHVALRRLPSFHRVGGACGAPDGTDGSHDQSSVLPSAVTGVWGRGSAPADGTDGRKRFDADVPTSEHQNLEGGAA